MGSIPTPTVIRTFLEEYGITASILSDTWIQARLTNFIVPYVERYTGIPLRGVQTITEIHSGNGTSVLYLDRRDSSIQLVNIEYIASNINSQIDISSVIVEGGEGYLKSRMSIESDPMVSSMFPKGNKNIRITYTIGRESASIPDDIVEAITYLASEQILGFIGARTGGGSLGMAQFNRNYGSRGKWSDIRNDLARQAKAILNTYNSGVVGN